MGDISILGVRPTSKTISTTGVELITDSTTIVRVRRIEIFQVGATAQTLGLGVPQAQGVTPVTTTFQRADRRVAASAVTLALSWATPPTVPAVFLKRWSSAAAAGASVIWEFDGLGLLVPASSSLTIYNITTAQDSEVNFVIEEFPAT